MRLNPLLREKLQKIADSSFKKKISPHPNKSTREHALHTELKGLFEEWGRPSTNTECWKKLKSINFAERDTVIQEIVPPKDNREAHILWLSPHSKERIMTLRTFNNFISKLRK